MYNAARRVPSWQLFQSQIHTETNLLLDSKIQNHEVITVFHQIEREAQSLIQNPSDPARVAAIALTIAKLAREGADIERTDVSRDSQRGDLLGIRQRHVTEFRRVEKEST